MSRSAVHVAFAVPTAAKLRRLAECHAGEPLSVAPGSTDGPCPAGMFANDGAGDVGAWPGDFDEARRAVSRLCMFELPWMRAFAPAPLALGTDVAVAGRVLGLWWTNVCRVVRIVDEPERAGFVYATLQSHMMVGEERFLVERRGDRVWFAVNSHARPAHWLARSGWSLVRAMQRRFAAQSVAAVTAAVLRKRRGPP